MSEKTPVLEEFTLEQLAEAALASRGITAGLWRFAAKLNFAAAAGEWDENGTRSMYPTGIVGVVGVALFPAEAPGPLVFDASKPKKKPSQHVATRVRLTPAKKKSA